jgi:hypothetical protein
LPGAAIAETLTTSFPKRIFGWVGLANAMYHLGALAGKHAVNRAIKRSERKSRFDARVTEDFCSIGFTRIDSLAVFVTMSKIGSEFWTAVDPTGCRYFLNRSYGSASFVMRMSSR